jgi:hypothetical protein
MLLLLLLLRACWLNRHAGTGMPEPACLLLLLLLGCGRGSRRS